MRIGAGASPERGEDVARGVHVTVPETSNMCGFDVALVELDREITSVPVAPVRFTPLQPGEQVTAVGFGVDGFDQPQAARLQRTTTVLGVGPSPIRYNTRQGTPIDYPIPEGDLATGEATCYGDSGGPLFDAQGAVVGVTSRGVDDYVPRDGNHGNGCIDLPSVFAGVRAHQALIAGAASNAGHPLDGAGRGREDDGELAGAKDRDDEDDEGSSRGPPKVETPSTGCRAAPAQTGDGELFALVVATLALRGRRRGRDGQGLEAICRSLGTHPAGGNVRRSSLLRAPRAGLGLKDKRRTPRDTG
jgi:hypothetical protein